MKRVYKLLSIIAVLSLFSSAMQAQFVVASDSIKGQIEFCPRPGDLTNSTLVPNDSVFYMYPPDLEIDPWRYVDFYTSSRKTQRGYIRGTQLMRIDDYELIDVERLSAHGSVSFNEKDVKVNVSVTPIRSNTSIKQTDKGYIVNGKLAKGVAKGQSPSLKYQSISVTIKGRTIALPKKLYEHLLEPEIDNMVVYYNPQKKIVYILANNGGIDAYYNVLWAVSHKGTANVYVFDPYEK